MNSIVGLIPAAGKGTRLAPLPFSKELFPLGYQRFLVNGDMQWRPKVVSQYLIDNMILAGIRRFFIILGSGKEAIMEYFGNGRRLGVDITYLFQEELYGMPFALDLARPWLHEEIVAFGMPDTVIQPLDAYRRLLCAHVGSHADLTLGAFPTWTPWKFGMIELVCEERVIRNVDKPQQTTLKYMWGLACWSKSFTELMSSFLQTNIPGSHEIVLAQIFQYAVEVGLDVRALRFDDGQYLDIGTVDELRLAIERYSVLPMDE